MDIDALQARLRANARAAPTFGAAIVADGRIIADHNGDTPLCACSTFKVACAAAVFSLAQEGRLSLDARVLDVDSTLDFSSSAHAQTITVGHLLSHTSGLDDTNKVEAEPRAVLGSLRCGAPPGVAFRYSNVGFDLAIELAAQIDGTSATEFVRARVLAPLGMTHTAPTELFPASAPQTTARDLAALALEVLGGGRVLSADSRAEMRRIHADSYTAAPLRFYGLGLGIERWGLGEELIAHGGGLGAFGSAFVLDPEVKTGAVFLFDAPGGYAVSPHAYLDALRGRALAPPVLEELGVDWRAWLGAYDNDAELADDGGAPTLIWKGRRTKLAPHDHRLLAGEGRISVGLLNTDPPMLSANDFILIGARPGVRLS